MAASKTTSKKYGRIRNARQNYAPFRACLLVAGLAAIMKMALAGSVHDMQRMSCDGLRNYLAGAEGNYYRKYHHFVVGGEDALQELVNAQVMRALPECRAGGHYTAVANPDGSLAIHCSIPDHDKDHAITRLPSRRRQ